MKNYLREWRWVSNPGPPTWAGNPLNWAVAHCRLAERWRHAQGAALRESAKDGPDSLDRGGDCKATGVTLPVKKPPDLGRQLP